MKILKTAVIILMVTMLSSCNSQSEKSAIPYHFANKDEAVSLYLSNDEYFEGFSPYDIQYRLQKKEDTLEEMKQFGADIVGRNTDYVVDPEECMAVNFSYAMTNGLEKKELENPEIVQAILDYCSKKKK